jgi:hypothetical protein
MSIKFKHCCFLEHNDYIEAEHSTIETDKGLFVEVVRLTINDTTLGTTELYLDRSTAVRFAKTIRTEINKIPQ